MEQLKELDKLDMVSARGWSLSFVLFESLASRTSGDTMNQKLLDKLKGRTPILERQPRTKGWMQVTFDEPELQMRQALLNGIDALWTALQAANLSQTRIIDASMCQLELLDTKGPSGVMVSQAAIEVEMACTMLEDT